MTLLRALLGNDHIDFALITAGVSVGIFFAEDGEGR